MNRSKNTFGLWSGVLIAVAGAVLVFFSIDYAHTNVGYATTFVDPLLISGGLAIVGCVGLAIGFIKMLMWWFGFDASKGGIDKS